MNALQIHIPAPFGHIMGVADPITELRTAPTDIAHLGHRLKVYHVLRDLGASRFAIPIGADLFASHPEMTLGRRSHVSKSLLTLVHWLGLALSRETLRSFHEPRSTPS